MTVVVSAAIAQSMSGSAGFGMVLMKPCNPGIISKNDRHTLVTNDYLFKQLR